MLRRLGRVAVPALVLAFGTLHGADLVGQQRSRDGGIAANFDADAAIEGSSLAGWRPLGDARWRAENGEVIVSAGSGWLLSEQSFEDVAMVASFRCAAACRTGLLVRAEPTAGGGRKGIFISLTNTERAAFRVTIDAQGREVSREALRPPGPGQLRVAPPPAPAPAGSPGGGGRGGPPPMPGGVPAPLTRPEATARAGEWNTVEVVLDANIVYVPERRQRHPRRRGRCRLRRLRRHRFFAASDGEVRFRKVAYKDLHARTADAEHVSTGSASSASTPSITRGTVGRRLQP